MDVYLRAKPLKSPPRLGIHSNPQLLVECSLRTKWLWFRVCCSHMTFRYIFTFHLFVCLNRINLEDWRDNLNGICYQRLVFTMCPATSQVSLLFFRTGSFMLYNFMLLNVLHLMRASDKICHTEQRRAIWHTFFVSHILLLFHLHKGSWSKS